jgi:hypothetical protein
MKVLPHCCVSHAPLLHESCPIVTSVASQWKKELFFQQFIFDEYTR